MDNVFGEYWMNSQLNYHLREEEGNTFIGTRKKQVECKIF